jgi:hypothetical protein
MNMKKTNNNAPMKRIAASATMLAVSAAMLGTSTYAWFTMNKEVTVTGMEVHTAVGSNLLIAQTTSNATAKVADSQFKTSDVNVMTGLLEPVSTITGADGSFFYINTKNVAGNGAPLATSYLAYDQTAFRSMYSQSEAVGYIDYAFELKANNTSGTTQYINVTDIDLTYGGTDTASLPAYRVAFFVEGLGTAHNNPDGQVPEGDQVTVLKSSTSAYFDTTGGGQAVKTAGARDAVTNLGTAATLATITADGTYYYKVVARLWLEGEDTACTNSIFNTLDDNWALDMTIELQDSVANAKDALDTAATASKTTITIGTTVTGDPVVIDGVSYYAITGASGFYKVGNTAVAAGEHIYKMTTIGGTQHPILVDNQVIIASGG